MNKVILNLSTVLEGGAGHYALQNHKLLLETKLNSFLIVKDEKKTGVENVINYPNIKYEKIFNKLKRNIFRRILNKISYDNKYYFYNKYEKINCYSAKTILKLLPQKPDFIFVYWVSGFINAKLLFQLHKITNAKIFIMLIDNAPLTGGCHYPWNCNGYKSNCSNCPAVMNSSFKLIAKSNLKFKIKYHLKDSIILAPTQTDFERTKHSSLFKHNQCIKMLEIVNEDIFVPVTDKKVARDYFGLSNVDKKIIFIGATFLDEERKGMKELLLSLKYLKSKNIFFIIAGTKLKGSFPFEYKYVGYLNQKDLVKAYQAADLFICPSLEDSGPLMINQSIMCGTPVVSFDMGSAQDILQTGQTGYKANFNDISDLAYGVDYILSLNKIEYEVMSNTCRKTAEAAYSRNVFKGIVSDLLVDK